MKILGICAVLLLATACAPVDPLDYRDDPRAHSNPWLLTCTPGAAPVCDVYGGRTRKLYSNCRCGAAAGGPT